MKYLIYIISIIILVTSLAITQLCMRKFRNGKTHILLTSAVYLSMTELMLTVCYLVTRHWLGLENFGTALLYFQTVSVPLALVMLQSNSPTTSKLFKLSIVIISLGLFNLLYFCCNTLYTPWWAYSIIIDILAIVISIFFPVNTAKAILMELSLVLSLVFFCATPDYFDYQHDNVGVYILISSLTVIIYFYFQKRLNEIKI